MFKDRSHLQAVIEKAWEERQQLTPEVTGEVPEAVREILFELDRGELRVAEKIGDKWLTHSWVKKAILLSFRLNDSFVMNHTYSPAYDKIPLKFEEWSADQFQEAGFRVVPGAVVRHSAYIAPGAVIMPSFINVGAYIDSGTMIDSAVRIGSCAQIGKNCHLSDNVGIGGVLEPPQADPVIIEDNCFIGACSEILEGTFVGEGSVLGAGVILTASTKIVSRETNAITYGYIPPYSVVVPGVLPDPVLTKPGLACAVIIKHVDEKTRSKTSINELLR
ncbi:MAG TPA: 2,3,4,5-tetrahydropyridine-2,6-dicarboxylate N-succinyltransferase [Alphaproteobacteria bacterium]|nr:2,3,4,5-tetrahydropyridine-2,6-dicarboxylate N-succinyltransferase [Alphaproteobacteria bacterium]